MFTGIITDLGEVRSVEERGGTRLAITTAYETGSIEIGASISCAGACLTVVDKDRGWFAADVSRETLGRTTLGRWTEGSPVNLERSLRLGDELGGHMVMGHVDGVSEITAIEPIEGGQALTLTLPGAIALERFEAVVRASRGRLYCGSSDRRRGRAPVRLHAPPPP